MNEIKKFKEEKQHGIKDHEKNEDLISSSEKFILETIKSNYSISSRYNNDAGNNLGNKSTAGTHIPIFHPDKVMESKPTTIFLLAWNFADEIINELKTKYNFKGIIHKIGSISQ